MSQNCHQSSLDARIKGQNALNSISAGAPPHTPFGELRLLTHTVKIRGDGELWARCLSEYYQTYTPGRYEYVGSRLSKSTAAVYKAFSIVYVEQPN